MPIKQYLRGLKWIAIVALGNGNIIKDQLTQVTKETQATDFLWHQLFRTGMSSGSNKTYL